MTQEVHPRRRAVLGTVLVACAAAVAVVVLQSGASRSPRARAGAAAPPAQPATLHALGDLAPGMALGPYQVRDVSEPIDGAVLVRATSPTGETTFEVRLLSDRPLPAAKTGTYAIYYRGTDGGADVLAGAAALAAALERAPKSAPLPGLTQCPTVFTSL
jgi:hypothetical protein